MNGFYFSGDFVQIDHLSRSRRVIAQVELPPGYYIIFAKVELQKEFIDELRQPNFWVQLELGDIKDEFTSAFVNDAYHPNDLTALIALNIAGEVKHTIHAKLVVSTGDEAGYQIKVINPRLSAIQVSELMISSGNLDISDYVDHVDSQELLNAGIKTTNLTSFKSKKSG